MVFRFGHVYFGLSESNNNINVLEASHLFSNITDGTAPHANYVIYGENYNIGYGIYPKWSTIFQIIDDPGGLKKYLQRNKNHVEKTWSVLFDHRDYGTRKYYMI